MWTIWDILSKFAIMKLSVIIPVYNVAATLERCIESVAHQSYRDMQIILVDDASTDDSKEICEQWRRKDHRIQVVSHKENLGLSAARNSGIDKAKGEYLTFVDSDDEVEISTYKRLFEILNVHPDYDLLEFPVYKNYGNIRRQHKIDFGMDKEYTDTKDYWLNGKAYEHAYAWNKIYKRTLFYGLRYPVGKKFEDQMLLPQLLKKCSCVATTSAGLYYYYDNPNGITQTAKGCDLEDLLHTHLATMKEMCDDDYYNAVLNIALDVYELTGKAIPLPSGRYGNGMKSMLNKLFGFNTLCLTNKLMHRIYRRNR